MGFGDFGSNGSVHWRIHHHDTGAPPDKDGVDNSKKHPKGSASPPRPNIGTKKGGKPEHDGRFRVTARYGSEREAYRAVLESLANLFTDPAQAKAAIEQAVEASNAQAANALKDAEVRLDVLVWNPMKNPGNVFTPAEISVDW